MTMLRPESKRPMSPLRPPTVRFSDKSGDGTAQGRLRVQDRRVPRKTKTPTPNRLAHAALLHNERKSPMRRALLCFQREAEKADLQYYSDRAKRRCRNNIPRADITKKK